ncbi:MAG: energy transducer TonB [Alphaproteobacteria bacterium]|nr:energy transducer TonB [Alphaproteobacteria bacterium]
MAFSGPAPGDDELRGRSLFALVNFFLVVVVAVIAALMGANAVRSTALLMGFSPQMLLISVPNSSLLLLAFAVLFMWVQFGHLVRLRSVWTRCRYVCLLVSLPLLVLILFWFAIGFAGRQHVLEGRALYHVKVLSVLLSVGAVPFFCPSLHGRVLAPVFNWAENIAGLRRREAVEYLGNAILLLGSVAIFALFLFMLPDHSGAPSMVRPALRGAPVPYGLPHVCESVYPVESARLGEQGTTLMSFVITTAGTVTNVSVLHTSGHPRLDRAAVVCVEQWTYLPAKVNGKAVAVPWKAEVIWRLR